MPWNSGLTKLNKLLADLYRTEERARMAVTFAGLDTTRISFQGAAQEVWFSILQEADRQGVVGAVVEQACEDAPARCDELTEAYNEYLELAAQLPAAPGPGSPAFPIFQVPYDRNPNFTGRGTYLDHLRINLTSGRPGARVQALTGLGGMGKTQLALEYAYRHQADYQLIWWLRAEEPATLAAEFARLAIPLRLPQADQPDQREITAAVCHWLTRNDGWLLIFDDAGDRDSLRGFLPQSGTGHILITSRNPAWRGTARTSKVQPLDLDDAIAFLLQRTDQDNEAAASDLAEAVGCIPLALEQAGAYIETTAMPLGDYVTLFSTRRAELWAQEEPPAGYPDTVATTWSLSMEKVEAESPAAADLLRLCAFLAAEDIPRELVTAGAELLLEPLSAVVQDSLQLSQAVAALLRYSLLDTAGDAWTMHRLVGTVVRDRLDSEAKHQWATAAANLVNDAFPLKSDDVRTWATCERLLPHAFAAAGHAEMVGAAPAPAARLLNQAGLYLKGWAAYPQAKVAFERALAIDEATFGPDRPNVATVVNNLGGVLQDLGNLSAARAAFERALAIDEATFGPDHPDVARDVNNLGSVLEDLGNLSAARAAFERALAIDEATFGPDHPDVARVVNNLGLVLKDLGDLPGARAALERALAIFQQHLGPNHPDVATLVNNLGLVLKDLGDLQGARAAYERALTIWTSAYGDSHPQVAKANSNLAGVLRALGDLTGAQAACERALTIDEAAFGPDHLQVARDVNNLSYVLEELGDLNEAHAAAARAYTILQVTLPEEHPNVQDARSHLEALRERLDEE